jgi:integral membrane sensor domain MASE1
VAEAIVQKLTLKSAGLIAAYLVAAKIALEFGTVNNSATIFWAPGGIALAALLLGGIKYLPAVFIAAFLAAVMVDAPLIFALGSSTGNALETLIGYSLIRRFNRTDLSLDRIQDLFTLILLGALIPSIASAILGPLTLLASGMINSELLPAIMWRWWRADVLGIVFFTPLILVCRQKKYRILKCLYSV